MTKNMKKKLLLKIIPIFLVTIMLIPQIAHAQAVEPQKIYFQKSNNEKDGYLTMKKGQTITVKAVIEPSNANTKNKIQYSISGSSRVATINSSTGQIKATQAGVVDVIAKTENGKTAKIKLNVKIGNNKFDLSKLTSQDNGDLLKGKPVRFSNSKNDKMQMQSFGKFQNDVANIHRAVINKADGKKNISYIFMDTNGELSPKKVTLKDFGHHNNIDVENYKYKDTWLHYDWVSSISLDGKTNNAAISRVRFQNKKEYNYGVGTVNVGNKTYKNSDDYLNDIFKNYNGNKNQLKECNIVFYNNYEDKSKRKLATNLQASVDEKNRLLGIYKNRYIYIYDLDEVLNLNTEKVEVTKDDNKTKIKFDAKVLNKLTPLCRINYIANKLSDNYKNGKPLDPDKDITSWSMNGFDLDGDNIYVGEGHAYSKTQYYSDLEKKLKIDDFDEKILKKGSYTTYISSFDYMLDSTKKYERKRVKALKKDSKLLKKFNSNKKCIELQGVKIYNGQMYLGITEAKPSNGTNYLSGILNYK